jgi:hypothetical protein
MAAITPKLWSRGNDMVLLFAGEGRKVRTKERELQSNVTESETSWGMRDRFD